MEICINEVWGTICDSGWNVADANVVCRQAGFSDSGQFLENLLVYLSLLQDVLIFLKELWHIPMPTLVKELALFS